MRRNDDGKQARQRGHGGAGRPGDEAAKGRRPPSPARSRPAPREPELRLHGINACLAAFAHRRDDLRKLWLTEANIPVCKPVLAWCVQHRIGYRVVAADELERLTASGHHEGVCMAMRQRPPLTLAALLADLPADAAAQLLWLQGIGNPHNLGAIIRSAAHFGVRAVLLGDASALSPAAWRVAEGGAETVSCIAVDDAERTGAALRQAGFQLAATVVRGGGDLYASVLPSRLVWLLGAERSGLPQQASDRADLRLRIPGTGAVESLNVSVAAALLMARWASGGR